MAFTRPTLPEIAERIRVDFVSRLTLTGAVLRRSMIYVISMVLAGAAHMLHGHLDFLAKQIFADTAEDSYLLRIGSMFGVERLEAAYAEGPVLVTGAADSVLGSGSIMVRSDGAMFETIDEAILTGGEATVEVRALSADEVSNTDADVVLILESPAAGVDSEATVDTAGIVGGRDAEDIDTDYRARVLARLRAPPNGGSAADYVAWTLEVAGFTRAFVHPGGLGAGTVVVYPLRDDDVDFIPSVGEVAELQAYLDVVRPVTAAVTVIAPTPDDLDPEIHLDPDSSARREAVTAELEDMLRRDAAVGNPDDAEEGTILLSHIEVAVGIAEGVNDFEVISPVANVVPAAGHIVRLGTITWS